MKIRLDFVTNSSSSSFVIDKRGLTYTQRKAIENHIKVAKKLESLGYGSFGCYDNDSEWYVRDGENNSLMLSTFMDNFDMREFLSVIGVSDKDIYDDARDISDDSKGINEWTLQDVLSEINSVDCDLDEDNSDDYGDWRFW